MSRRQSDAGVPRESTAVRWRRRAISVPAVLLSLAAWTLLLPALLLITLIFDLSQRRRLALTRSALMLEVYLACEALGILTAALLWLAARGRPQRLPGAHYRLQRIWSGALFAAGRALFGFTLRVEDWPLAERGPAIVLMRHASLPDVLLPSVLFGNRFRIELRYVLKRELLWDPCLDLVGQRIPNSFVDRSSDDPEVEIDRVGRLADNLPESGGLLIFPEGTRFTHAKQARVRASLEEKGDHTRLELAQRLKHLLPPQRGGALALLAAAPNVDVILVAHVGFEHVVSPVQLLRGSLIGKEIRAKLWRIPAEEIPRDTAGRIAWLEAEWSKLDLWIDRNATGS